MFESKRNDPSPRKDLVGYWDKFEKAEPFNFINNQK